MKKSLFSLSVPCFFLALPLLAHGGVKSTEKYRKRATSSQKIQKYKKKTEFKKSVVLVVGNTRNINIGCWYWSGIELCIDNLI